MKRPALALLSLLMCVFFSLPARAADAILTSPLALAEAIGACKTLQNADQCERDAKRVLDGLRSGLQPNGGFQSTELGIIKSSIPDVYAMAKIACEKGSDTACLLWARNLDDPLPQLSNLNLGNRPLAKQLYTASCKRRPTDDCVQYASTLLSRSKAPEYSDAEANAIFLEAQGFYAGACDYIKTVYACVTAGDLYAEGRKGVGKNLKLAADAHYGGCSMARDPKSCAYGAKAAMEGLGISKNMKLASEFAETGCKLNGREACNIYTKIFLDGQSELRDPARARALLAEGCGNSVYDYEHKPATCQPLADLYYEGLGGPVDKETAIAIYGKICQFAKKTELTPRGIRTSIDVNGSSFDSIIHNYQSREFAKPCYRSKIDAFERMQQGKEFSKKYRYRWLTDLYFSCLIMDPAACPKIRRQAKAVEFSEYMGDEEDYRCTQMMQAEGCIDYAKSVTFNRDGIKLGLEAAIKLDPSVKKRKDVIDLAKKAGMSLE